MKEIILAKYGEIILKGGNRPKFENILMNNIRNSLKNVAEVKARLAQATIYVEVFDEDKMDIVVERLSKIFGIVSITRAVVCEKDIEDIKAKVEVRDFGAYVYADENKVQGQGGMPIGTGSKATLLLSGGIDSPVAGHMISKRGVEIDAVNFFSFPYTSERAKEKVIELASIIAQYTSKINLYIVPFTEIQLQIAEKCPEEHLTLVMRRFMMRIAERLARKHKSLALVTGESVGQVASQTLAALDVTNSAVDMPVLQPLIGMDKIEIVDRAHEIGTFETSILPYEDCCTVFTPKHPTTNPKRANIEKSENRLDVETLIEAALAGVEKIEVYPK